MSRRKSFLIKSIISTSLLFLVILFFIHSVGSSWNEIYDDRQKDNESANITPETEENDSASVTPIEKPQTKYSILLLGIDTFNVEVGRSDAIILAIVDIEAGDVQLLSIPRDTYVQIYGRGYDKINHAYAYGGADLSIKTIEQFLGIPIDYYVSFNFDGVKDFVDAIGGLELEVEKNMTFRDRLSKQVVSLSKGKQILSGEQVLHYARYRGDSDHARQQRQQQIIKALIDQTADLRNITKVNEMLEVLGNNVRTDLPLPVLMQFITKAASAPSKHVESVTMSTYSDYINGTYYAVVSDEERERLQTLLQGMLQERKEEEN